MKDTRRQDFTTKEKKPRKSYYKPVDRFQVKDAQLWKPPERKK